MKKRITIYFCLIICMIIMCAMLSSCNKISFSEALIAEGNFGYDNKKNTYCISENISSKNELEEMCKEMQNGYYDISSDHYDSEIGIKIRTYDNAYFEKNNLIIFVLYIDNHYKYNVRNLKNVDNKIVINVKKRRKIGINYDVIYSYVFILEVEKKYINNLELIEINF